MKISAESFDSTINQLGFISPIEYENTPAKLVCQDSECIKGFSLDFFDSCNNLWNFSSEDSSAIGKLSYSFTGIYSCENKDYIYYSESPPTKIKIAEIK